MLGEGDSVGMVGGEVVGRLILGGGKETVGLGESRGGLVKLVAMRILSLFWRGSRGLGWDSWRVRDGGCSGVGEGKVVCSSSG